MTSVPPPYSSRDHGQVQSGGPGVASSSTNPSGSGSTSTTTTSGSTQEFSETTSVCLEWRLSGLKNMYDSTKGEQKSKCIKSAVFGDADNLWEVLWYPNAGSSNQTAGDHVSLYLSCVPTTQERESTIGNKWTRKGLWWFKFEVRPTNPHSDIRSTHPQQQLRSEPLASKDASDHTFAVKTANWGWQAFAKRDALFQNPAVLATDSFMIVCTIQPQPQPPAGIWLGIGLQPPHNQFVTPNNKGAVGSGGGLSAWSTADGHSAGVASGQVMPGGMRRVVPKDLISSVGSMLDDPLYSDVEFIIPGHRGTTPRKIFANKKLLNRCGYFSAMFNGGFSEMQGDIEEDEYEEEVDMLSDSDFEDEMDALSYTARKSQPQPDLHLTTTTSRASSSPRRHSLSIAGDATATAASPISVHAAENHNNSEGTGPGAVQLNDETGSESSHDGAGAADITLESEDGVKEFESKRGTNSKSPALPSASSISTSGRTQTHTQASDGKNAMVGPKKTRVVVRDAAWSTWWALLYWVYTDTIYFAPLSSSFERSKQNSSRGTVSGGNEEGPTSRLQWINDWMLEHDIEDGLLPEDNDDDEDEDEEDGREIGPRPVSAKSIYRLADKLDLQILKLRAFQHIVQGLTAQNVPAEVFSRFSSTYEDVRRVQVAFFLKHWTEIKKSETMMQIWQQIRHGKHVGFEEVWPLIVGQLDFKPS